MANNLYSLFNMQNMLQGTPFGNIAALMQQLNQFRSNFTGNPEQIVRNRLQSGQYSQSQFEQFGQLATQIQNLLPH